MNTDGIGWTAIKRTNSPYDKRDPQLQVVGRKINYVWYEHDSMYFQIWTAEMNINGTDWSTIKETTSSYNKYYPQLQVVGTKIYYVWYEGSDFSQIWTAEMNSNIINKGDFYGIGISNHTIKGFINAGVNGFKYNAEAINFTAGATVESIIDSNWNHIVMTYNKSILKLYINGDLVNTSSFTEAINTNPFDLIIGDDFNGVIDEVNISVSTVWLKGYCYYENMTSVDNLTVEIINTDTGQKWQAYTVGNYYSLELLPGTDINASETLRFIAKDDTSYVNVDDYTVSQNDIDAGGISTNLTLNEYYLDLTDFPMYGAEDDNPIYTVNQLSGPAVAQMNLDYMWWNSSNDSLPPTWSEDTGWNQSNLFIYGQENNSNISLPFMDATGMWHTIQTLDPEPYSEYGYNFGIYHNIDRDIMLAQICQWIDYPAGIKPGHPLHVPGAVPTFGGYSNWMSVRGIHTNTSAYPLPSALDILGFWVNDPYSSGIGENSYKMATEFDTYYQPINVVDDPYNGEYVVICEPPFPDEECDLTLVLSPERWEPLDEPPGFRRGGMTAPSIRQVTDDTAIQAAIDGVTDQLIPYDPGFEGVFRQSYPGRPIFVKNLIEEKDDFYAVPFTIIPTTQPIKMGTHQDDDDEITMVVVLVDANDGHFKEASWVQEPVKYLPISRTDALEIVFDELIEMGINPEELNAREIKTDLVYRDSSPYYPDWRIVISELGLTFFVNQEGILS
jgi:hypothetical protein